MSCKQFCAFRLMLFVLIGLQLSQINAASGHRVWLEDLSVENKPLSWLIMKMDSMPEQRCEDDTAVENQLSVFRQIKHLFIPFTCICKLIEDYISRFQGQFNSVSGANLSYCQKQVVPIGSEVALVGDIHGSAHSLLKIIKNYVDDNFKIIKDNFYIVFTGDYVDRGMYGVEVWYTLLRLKLANWDKVFVLRGNHENLLLNSDRNLGFYAELAAKYGECAITFWLNMFDDLYQRLVLVLYLKSGDSWVQCCHGGIDPCCNISAFLSVPDMLGSIDFDKVGHGRTNTVNGFMWADFQGDGSTIEMNLQRLHWTDSFSTYDMIQWFKESGIRAIFRGHQHDLKGLSLFKDQAQFGLPTQWEMAVTQEELQTSQIKVAQQKIPIFTFTTATEYEIADRAVYGILRTGTRFEDWILMPMNIEKTYFIYGSSQPLKPSDSLLSELKSKLSGCS